MSATLAEICAALGGVLHGEPGLSIDRLASLESADADSLSFVAQARYASQIASTGAGALIVPPALLEQARARRLHRDAGRLPLFRPPDAMVEGQT